LEGGLLPVSLFLARRDVMNVFTPGDHGSTFQGNPIAAAVGLAVLDTLIEERLVNHAATVGAHLLRRLARSTIRSFARCAGGACSPASNCTGIWWLRVW